jgi:hypothetical protein
MRAISLPLLAAVSACTPEQVEVVPYTTQDVMIDGGTLLRASRPRICVAGDTVHAVWQEERTDGGRDIRWARGRALGAVWNAPITLNSATHPGTRAEAPDLACAGDSAYVVWEDDRNSDIGEKDIYLRASMDAGETWEDPFQLTSDEHSRWDSLGPRIALREGDDGDEVDVVWYDNRDGAYDIWFRASTDGTTWGEEHRLDTDEAGAAYSANPQIALDGIGGVYVVWEDSRTGRNDVHTNHSFDGGAHWQQQDTRLDGSDGGSSDAFGVALAVDADAVQPAVYVAWHDDRNAGKDIFLARSPDAGVSWDVEPARMETDGPGASNSFFPSVVAVGGRVRVAWYDDRDIGTDIYIRGSDDAGASWGEEQRLDMDLIGSAHSTRPQLRFDGQRAVAGWLDRRRGPDWTGTVHPDIWYRSSEDGGDDWSGYDGRVDDDPQSSGISDDVQIALSGPGAHFLWVDWRRGTPGIYYRRMPSAVAAPAD